MKQCIVCLENISETNTFHKYQFNCQCKYNIHSNCLNKWFRQAKKNKCMICKETITIKPRFQIPKFIQPVVSLIVQMGFVVVLIIYIAVLNVAYVLNAIMKMRDADFFQYIEAPA
jgi:hypothetical protein